SIRLNQFTLSVLPDVLQHDNLVTPECHRRTAQNLAGFQQEFCWMDRRHHHPAAGRQDCRARAEPRITALPRRTTCPYAMYERVDFTGLTAGILLMDISVARTFLEVVKTGSFVNAAASLNLTQTAVSARIRVLEEQLQRPVFIRNKAGARLTP